MKDPRQEKDVDLSRTAFNGGVDEVLLLKSLRRALREAMAEFRKIWGRWGRH